LFGLLGTAFFYLYPLALGGIGVRGLARYLGRARRHFRSARARARRPPSLLWSAAFALGTLAFAVVYLSIMVPENAAFDARSYHLPIAEHFAAGGRIARFPEGWFAGTLPHLASWLYTWPFTLRSVNLFAHVSWRRTSSSRSSSPRCCRRRCWSRRSCRDAARAAPGPSSSCFRACFSTTRASAWPPIPCWRSGRRRSPSRW